MPKLRIYKLFISHAWDYKDEYYRLVEMLDSAPYFKWSDYSVPFHDPIDSSSARELKNQIKEQIRQCTVFIFLAGMWVKYHDWILFEIKSANSYSKPILAVKPQGQQKVPSEVYDFADRVAGWRTESIASAIRDLAK